jgi:carboxypeptidase Taq
MGPNDCRLTTRYDESEFASSLYGVLHEAGHGLYDQGLSKEDYGTPMGEAISLGIHESQSRLWENRVGRSLEFWEHWFPRACHHFPELKKLSPEQIVKAVNRVAPSFIRVEADELTYDLHIILRFEMEKRLISEELSVSDLPQAWNETFEKSFGLKVPNDAQGCLQDIHWSMGGFGYFPTYTLGNLNASQLFRAATTQIPELTQQLRQGKYTSLLSWLRKNVHQQGQRYHPLALIEKATGEAIRPDYHFEFLRKKIL